MRSNHAFIEEEALATLASANEDHDLDHAEMRE